MISPIALTDRVHSDPRKRLQAYDRALDVVASLDDVAHCLGHRRADLADQLRRASASILLDLAEGADEFSAPEKARFYRMARRSAAECMAIVDLAERIVPELPSPHDVRAGRWDISAMLTALARRQSER